MTTTERVSPVDRFVQAFERLNGSTLNGSAAVAGMRSAAINRFSELGIPNAKNEAWKYTNIEKALRHEFVLATEPAPELPRSVVDNHLIHGLDADVLVLVNGKFVPNQSRIGDLPAGVILTGFAEATRTVPDLVSQHYGRYVDARNETFAALNTAFATDGAFVYVPSNVVLERPVHVLSLLTTEQNLMLQPRLLYVVESGAQATVIETSRGRSKSRTLTNSVTEAYVGPNARFEHYKVQDLGEAATQIYNVQVYQERDSVFTTNTVTLSGRLVRNNLSFLPNAENCETHLYGLFLGRGRSHIDSHTLVDHARPNCFSNELYKGVLEDEATGVFNGKVYVRRDAQQTNAYQSNKSIVLSERAQMYSKPELEIYADDVKCSHGATTGQLDPEALFYLRSRGLTERQARALLLQAFARDVIDNIKVEPLRLMLDEYIVERFHE